MRFALDIFQAVLVAACFISAGTRLASLRPGRTFESRQAFAVEAVAFAIVGIGIAIVHNLWKV